MKKLLTFALTALLLACASVNVLADDAVVTEDTAVTAAEETTVSEPFAIDGMTKVEVTSSDASLDVDTGNFYDALPETKCTITFDAEAERSPSTPQPGFRKPLQTSPPFLTAKRAP